MNPAHHPTPAYRGNLYCYQPGIQDQQQPSYSQLPPNVGGNHASDDAANKYRFQRMPCNLAYFSAGALQSQQYDPNYDHRLQQYGQQMAYFQGPPRPAFHYTKEQPSFPPLMNGYAQHDYQPHQQLNGTMATATEHLHESSECSMDGSTNTTNFENNCKFEPDRSPQASKPPSQPPADGENSLDGLPSCASSQRNSSDKSPSLHSNLTSSPVASTNPSTPQPYSSSRPQVFTPESDPNRFIKPKTSKNGTASGSSHGSSLDALLRVVEIDPSDQERRQFADRLRQIWIESSIKFRCLPTITKKPIDLYNLYKLVRERNGYVEVTMKKRWREVANGLGIFNCQSAAFGVKRNYTKLGILQYECTYDLNGADPEQILRDIEAQKPPPGTRKRRRPPRSEMTNSPEMSNKSSCGKTSNTLIPTPPANMVATHPSYGRMINSAEGFDQQAVYRSDHSNNPLIQYERFAGDINSNASFPPPSYRMNGGNEFEMKYENQMFYQPPPQRMFLQSPHVVPNGYVGAQQNCYLVRPMAGGECMSPYARIDGYGQRMPEGYLQRPGEEMCCRIPGPYYGEQAAADYGASGGNQTCCSQNSIENTSFTEYPDIDSFVAKTLHDVPGSEEQTFGNAITDLTQIPEDSKLELRKASSTAESLKVQSLSPQQWRRRIRKKKFKTGNTDIWRILMMLRSGMAGEVSWALNAINSIMTDDNNFSYFDLCGLPGLDHTLVSALKASLAEFKLCFNADDLDKLISDDAVDSDIFNECQCDFFSFCDSRCLAASTALRNLSFIPSNKAPLAKNRALFELLVDLLGSQVTDVDNPCIRYLSVALRGNSLVTFSNIAEAINLSTASEQCRKKFCKLLFHWCTVSVPLLVEPHLSAQLLSIEVLMKLSTATLQNRDLLLAHCTDRFAQRMFSTVAEWLIECDQTAVQTDALVRAELAVCLLLLLLEKQRPLDLSSLLQGLVRHIRQELQSGRSGSEQCALKCARGLAILSAPESPMKARTRNWLESNLAELLFSGNARQQTPGRRRRPLTDFESVHFLIAQCLRKLSPHR